MTEEKIYPDCYEPEKDNPYPLCVGSNKKECENCCLYTNLSEPPFDK